MTSPDGGARPGSARAHIEDIDPHEQHHDYQRNGAGPQPHRPHPPHSPYSPYSHPAYPNPHDTLPQPEQRRPGLCTGLVPLGAMAAATATGSAFVIGGMLAGASGFNAVLLAAAVPLGGLLWAIGLSTFKHPGNKHPGNKHPGNRR